MDNLEKIEAIADELRNSERKRYCQFGSGASDDHLGKDGAHGKS